MASIEQFLNNLYTSSVKNKKSVYDQAWRQDLKAQLLQALGDFNTATELTDPVVIEEVDMDSYTRKRVEITTVDCLRMLVYVLVPKKRTKDAAVIALHGHGYGSREIVGLQPDGSVRLDAGIHKHYAAALAEQGFVVFAPELIGFGDRKLEGIIDLENPSNNSCQEIGSQLLLFGKTIAGLRIAECRRLIDYVQQFYGYDKIGMLGLSGGGLVAAYTSAVDERIDATVISGYTNTFKGSIIARRHCLDNYLPGILQYAEMPELIGLIAPRPLFIEAGDSDPLFPIKHVEEALVTLTEIYQSFDAPDKLSSHVFPGGHEFSGEYSYRWLIDQL